MQLAALLQWHDGGQAPSNSLHHAMQDPGARMSLCAREFNMHSTATRTTSDICSVKAYAFCIIDRLCFATQVERA